MRRVALIAAVAVVLISGTTRAGDAGRSPAPPESHIYSTVGSTALHAYVFRPDVPPKNGRSPAILIFHGGGWAFGSAEWAFPRARHFAQRGFVAIAVQYRLSDQKLVTPVEAMADASSAIAWARRNADRLGVDPKRIAAYGWSAGAHLAASAAIFDSSPRRGRSPNALILVSPAVSLENEGWFRRLMLGHADVQQVDPSKHVREGLPPTIILQGDVDTVTPLQGVQKFCNRMRDAGNTCELELYKGYGHLFTPAGTADDGDPKPDPRIQAASFVRIDSFLRKLGYITE